MYLLEVYVTNASLNINHSFTYISYEEVKRFTRVRVVFNHKVMNAFVVDVINVDRTKEELSTLYGYQINEIVEIIDKEAILSLELYNLAIWLSKTTISPFISCLNTMLPKTLKTAKNTYKVVKKEYIKLNGIDGITLSDRQKEVYTLLSDGMLLSEARKHSPSIVNKLIDNHAISIYTKDAEYSDGYYVNNENFKTLTSEQNKVFNDILNSHEYVNLLYGITGSGKTEVFLHLARHYINMHKQVLILVPEIALTPQMIKRVKSRFDNVAIYHSYLSDQEKHYQYQKVLNKEVNVVVGTRSSIFLPFDNLGMIIVDEEHDHSYKQDNVPCYSAKTVAFKRALDHKAKVLLASATPSLESYSRALKGDYKLHTLNHRINDSLPNIEIIDIQKELKTSGSYMLSIALKEAIYNTLNDGKQVIILLNRRGYAPVVKCGDCAKTLMCSECDVALSYHKDENQLKCHICGKTYQMPKICPHCGSKNILQYGFGTKRICEELSKLYPLAKIGRMDADSTNTKNSHSEILDQFEKGEINILVGTQMIAKGLDYPNVTLVGILNADAGLMHDDYNSAENTFALLMQASGRSGRAKDEGKVIIQAFNADHYVLDAVLNQDYNKFYQVEMNYRNRTFYPPYSHLVSIVIKDVSSSRIQASYEYLYEKLNKLPYKQYRPIKLGKIKGYHRYRFLIKDKNIINLLNDISKIVDDYTKQKNLSSIKIDIDPLYLE